MGSLPLVSVIIPVFNAQDTIQDCISSVLEQNYPVEGREIIVVDNGSTDQTKQCLDQFSNSIRVVEEHKRGPSAARNAGINVSNASTLAFVDADTVADPEWLRNITAPLRGTTPGQVGGAIVPDDPDHPLQAFGKATHDNSQAIAGLDIPYIIGANFACLKSVIERVGMFNESLHYGEDVDLSWRIQQAGLDLLYVPEAVVYHDNEKTLWGLFCEGRHHGSASVQTHKIHSDFLAQRGYRRNSFNSFTRLLRAIRRYIKGQNRAQTSSEIVFESGKVLGKLYGSLRYGYCDI